MTRSYNYDDDPYVRQSRGLPYHMPQDRYLTSALYEGSRNSRRRNGLPPYEDSHSDQDSEDPKARKRIPVACGRCRKRKIRCSGPQHDSSCTNCKNAGNSDCQFNRVQSVEAHYREDVFLDKPSYTDRTTDFAYDPDLARAVQCRGNSLVNSYTPQDPGYAPMPNSLNYAMHRQQIADYQSQTKSASYIPAYGSDYGEENSLDYTLSGPSQPTYYGQEYVGITSANASPGLNRDWIPLNHYTKSSAAGMYGGPYSTIYGTTQLQYTSPLYPLRTSIGNEANNFSFGSMASTLPTPSPHIGSQRVLPMPPIIRTNTVTIPSNRPIENPHYGNSAAKAHLTESASLSYLPYSGTSNSIDSYNTSALSASLDAPHEVYAPTNVWTSQPGAAESSLLAQSQDSSIDLDYNTSNERFRKISQSFNVTLPHIDRELWATPSIIPESNIRGQNPAAGFRSDNEPFRRTSQSGQTFLGSMSSIDRDPYVSPRHREHAQLATESVQAVRDIAQAARQTSTDMGRSTTHRSSHSSLRSRKSANQNQSSP